MGGIEVDAVALQRVLTALPPPRAGNPDAPHPDWYQSLAQACVRRPPAEGEGDLVRVAAADLEKLLAWLAAHDLMGSNEACPTRILQRSLDSRGVLARLRP